MPGGPVSVDLGARSDHRSQLDLPQQLLLMLLLADAAVVAMPYMGFACLPCILVAVDNPSADDAGHVVDAVRHPGRSPAMGVLATSVDIASDAVGARLSMGFQHLPDSVRYHNSGCAQGHARGGIAGIARSRSCWVCFGV
jgi:hypothetical protein